MINLAYAVERDNTAVILAGMRRNSANNARMAAYFLKNRAQEYAPVDTGFLRDSIEVVRQSPQQYYVFVGADYGVYVEMGTQRAGFKDAQPYMQPASVEAAEYFVTLMRATTFEFATAGMLLR